MVVQLLLATGTCNEYRKHCGCEHCNMQRALRLPRHSANVNLLTRVVISHVNHAFHRRLICPAVLQQREQPWSSLLEQPATIVALSLRLASDDCGPVPAHALASEQAKEDSVQQRLSTAAALRLAAHASCNSSWHTLRSNYREPSCSCEPGWSTVSVCIRRALAWVVDSSFVS